MVEKQVSVENLDDDDKFHLYDDGEQIDTTTGKNELNIQPQEEQSFMKSMYSFYKTHVSPSNVSNRSLHDPNDQTPDQAFEIMEKQFQREKICFPKSIAAQSKCLTIAMHTNNQTMYMVAQGHNDFEIDKKLMRPEGYLDEGEHIPEDSQEIQQKYTVLESKQLTEFFESKKDTQSKKEEAKELTEEDKTKLWLRFSKVKIDPSIVDKKVFVFEEGAIELDPSIIQFYSSTDSFKTHIHVTPFNNFWCYFTEKNDEISIHVGQADFRQRTKEYKLDDQATKCFSQLLEASNRIKDPAWKWDPEDIFHHYPLFCIAQIESALVLVIYNPYAEESQVNVFKLEDSDQENSKFMFKYSDTGLFLQQITKSGQAVILQNYIVNYISLDKKVEKEYALNFNWKEKDNKPEEKPVNGLMRTDLQHLIIQYRTKDAQGHFYRCQEDKNEFQLERIDRDEEVRALYLFERLEGQNYEYVERIGPLSNKTYTWGYMPKEVQNEELYSSGYLYTYRHSWIVGIVGKDHQMNMYQCQHGEKFLQDPQIQIQNFAPVNYESFIVQANTLGINIYDYNSNHYYKTKFCQEFYLVNLLKNPQTCRIQEGIFGFINDFYLIQFEIYWCEEDKVRKLNLKKPVQITNKDLINLLRKENLQAVCRVDEHKNIIHPPDPNDKNAGISRNIDEQFFFIFQETGLITSNLKDKIQTTVANTKESTLNKNLITFVKTETRTLALMVSQDNENKDSRVYAVDKIDYPKTKPNLVYTFDGQLVHFVRNQNLVFIMTRKNHDDSRVEVHMIEYENDSFTIIPKKIVQFSDNACNCRTFIHNQCLFHQKWIACKGFWFVFGDDYALQVESPDQAYQQKKEYDRGFTFTDDNGFEKLILETKHKFQIYPQLHSRVAFSKNMHYNIHQDRMVVPQFFSSSSFIWKKDDLYKIIQNNKVRELGTKSEHEVNFFLDQTKNFILFNRGQIVELSAEFGLNMDELKKEFSDESKHNDIDKKISEKWDEKIRSESSYFLIDGKTLHVVCFHNDVKQDSKDYYRLVEDDQIDLHTWRLPTDNFGTQHERADITPVVKQTNDYILFNQKTPDRVLIYSKNKLKEKADLEPKILKNCQVIEVEDNIAEISKDKGRFLYDIKADKNIEYFEIKNDQTFEDPSEFPAFRMYSNRSFLTNESTDCLLNLRYSREAESYTVERFFSFNEYGLMKRIYNCPNDKKSGYIVEAMTVDNLFSTYGNTMSFFMMFQSSFAVTKTINQMISGTCQLIPYESPRLTQFQEINRDKLAFILNKKDLNDKTVFDSSIKNFPIYEKLIELVNMSHGIPLQYNFERLFPIMREKQSAPVIEHFDENLLQTDILANISKKEWPDHDKEEVMFSSSSPVVTDEEVQRQLTGDQKKDSKNEKSGAEKIEVLVKRVSFKLNEFKTIIDELNLCTTKDQEEIFDKRQVQLLIDFLWDNYYHAKIKELVLYPYLALIVVEMLQYLFFLDIVNASVFFWVAKVSLTTINALLSIYLIRTEMHQLKESSLCEYLGSLWNLLALAQFGVNITTVTLSYFEHEDSCTLYSLAAVSMMISFSYIFYFMQLHDELAWFIILLKQTVKDLRYLMIVFTFCLLTFSTTFTFLNMSLEDQNAEFIAPVTGFASLDALGSTYLLGLGQFNPDYNGTNFMLCWTIFILATILNLLIFMNMIIAQMGDSFEDCQGKKFIIINQSKVMLIQEFMFIAEKEILQDQEKKQSNNEGKQDDMYLYVVEKIQPEGLNTASWQGKIVQMQRTFKREIQTIKVSMDTRQKETRTLVKNVDEKTHDTRRKIMDIIGQVEDVGIKLDSIEKNNDMIESKIDSILKFYQSKNEEVTEEEKRE